MNPDTRIVSPPRRADETFKIGRGQKVGHPEPLDLLRVNGVKDLVVSKGEILRFAQNDRWAKVSTNSTPLILSAPVRL